MTFEFDPSKSKTNKAKHGKDFIAAQALWDDPDVLEIPLVVADKPRSLLCVRGLNYGRCCSRKT